MDDKARARSLLDAWKGDAYRYGTGVLDAAGGMAAGFGGRALLVASMRHPALRDAVEASLRKAGVAFRTAPAAKPNAPREDVYRLATYVLQYRPEVIVAVGGGSTIDACKAADALAVLGGEESAEIDAYFGTGLVSAALGRTRRTLVPLVAVQTCASSASHLTKYSNITDPVAGQKKLIVDEALVPPKAVFDYGVSVGVPLGVTRDGILDAVSHTFEAYCGAKDGNRSLLEEIAVTALELCLAYGPRLVRDLSDREAREAIGLASDLGGYAIMTGATSGAHLTSFSLVDLVGHGTACGLMNPYYIPYYEPAIHRQLAVVGAVFERYGYGKASSLSGRPLALEVARAMRAFFRDLGSPVTLRELSGYTPQVAERALQAAKDPQLAMKLRNMPVPMEPGEVDTYLRPILRAAETGDLSLVRAKG